MNINERYLAASKLFTYCEITGIVRRLSTGTIQQSKDRDGYLVTTFSASGSRHNIKLHRLAWFISNGFLPVEIDHINRDKTDNRICNLRNVNHLENCQNRLQTGNGVSYRSDRKKWRARAKYNGIEKHIGHFDTKEEAIEARNEYLANRRAIPFGVCRGTGEAMEAKA